ncbi:MAG: GxGYxYP family putative glycoside hydrolase [Chitinophagaceae bacterium]
MALQKNKIVLIFLCIISTFHSNCIAGWPVQKAPLSVVKCKPKNNDIREMNLAQSIAGLAAQALNDGINTEGVWIEGSKNYETYYARFIHRIAAKENGNFDVWQLIRRYEKTGIIKGYILYDASKIDNTINLATVLAGIKKGVLIDIRQEGKAKDIGLIKLDDARERTISASLFDSLKNNLSNSLICLLKPSMFNNRDYAIAHKSMVYYGVDNLLDTILQWVAPLSPVIGWNQGVEFNHIAPCTKYALFNTATDWCQNLAMLSVANASSNLPAFKSLNPKTIDFKEQKNYHAFVLSDGDNMQWTMGNFINNHEYWANDNASFVPMSFSTCAVNLSQAAPDAYHKLIETQPANVSMAEFGGGYYYPDLFASGRHNRDSLLRLFAIYLNHHMKLNGTHVLIFICKDVSSEATTKAYQIFSDELKDVVGMIAIPYSPYNGGHGKVYWIKNKLNIDIPVMTASYQLWVDLRNPGSGDPDSVAHWINLDVKSDNPFKEHFGWTIVHAWSSFNNPQDSTEIQKQHGVEPVVWTKKLIDSSKTKIVSIEELLWRLRMVHNERQTKNVISHWDVTPNGQL